MQVCRHDDIEKDFKNLKRFSAQRESLEAWEKLFCLKGLKETPAIDSFSGFGNQKIYKARVVPLKESIGKSNGYRLIFQVLPDSSCRILVFSRQGVYKTEQELMNIIRHRIKN
jgi:hypothetical protein